MKKGVFIRSNFDTEKNHAAPWPVQYYNSRTIEGKQGEGLVTFKKEFTLSTSPAKVSSAKLRATALGVFDLFFNGERVGSYENGELQYDEMKPGWTDFRFRVFEFEYDVTAQIKQDNNITVMVSPGWWSGRISFGFYGYRPCAFCGELEITYADGATELIASGTDWQTCLCGPTLNADIWDGETCDARIPHPALVPSCYAWVGASEFTEFCESEIELMPLSDRVRVHKELERRPISAVVYDGARDNGTDFGTINTVAMHIGDGCECICLKKGERIVLDMGQNMVGRPYFEIKAESGTRLECFFSEMLNDSGLKSRGNDGPKGSPYILNYRSALARVIYIAKGGQVEAYRPTHTFYGFRYLEITADADIELVRVRGEVMYSDFKETASFECDDPEINQLWSNIVWGMRGNYLSVPTDCPQRDERLGWSGDTQIFSGAATYIGDVRCFLEKWLLCAADSQQGYNGAYGDVIPGVLPDRINGNGAWADAGIIVPYRLWLMYNDTEIIEKHYPSMEYYMQFLEGYGLEGPNTAYGDWLSYEKTPSRYVSMAYYKYDADLMTKFSELLGKADRTEYYKNLSDRIKAHFAEQYIENGMLAVTSQTAYILALAFDLLNGEEERAAAIECLKNKIVDNDYTLSTGFVGTGLLNQTLSSIGLDSLAYSLLLQTKDPSWLYSVRQGATTIWERWNSYTKATGFGNVGMNSFNHYAYGVVGEWMMSTAAGIKPDPEHPGFRRFILAPTPDMRADGEIPTGQNRINRVSASYESYCGRISSSWERINGAMVYKLRIPSDTTASVKIPVAVGQNVEINGISFEASALGVFDGNRLCFELASGEYKIIVS